VEFVIRKLIGELKLVQKLNNKAVLIGIILLSLLMVSIDMSKGKGSLMHVSASNSLLKITVDDPSDNNDTSVGNFSLDIDNDPPVFIDWFDSQSIITPNDPITFWAIVEDVDNSSGELTVTLYYSNDSFNLINVSQTMTYVSSPDTYQHQFEYTMAGQTAGTYYQYYYQAYDGESYVKEDNTGLYYDIQWQTVDRGQGQPAVPTTEVPIEEIIFRIDWLLILALIIILVVSVFAIRKFQQKQEGKISW